MSELTIAVETGRTTMEEIQPGLDAALKEEFPGGMLKWRWEEDVLHLWGPGAKATIVMSDGRLVGHAELGPPANLMRPVIEKKIARVMKKAAD